MRASKPTPTCSISSAACSRFAAERPWCPAASARPRRGATGGRFPRSRGRVLRQADGQRRWLAGQPVTMPWRASTVRCSDYLADPARLKRFYTAVRGRITSPGPARPVFRSNTDMMLLTTRLRIEPDGKPHIPGQPGGLEDPFHQPSAGQVRRQADPPGRHAGKIPTTSWRRSSPCAARPWKTSR